MYVYNQTMSSTIKKMEVTGKRYFKLKLVCLFIIILLNDFTVWSQQKDARTAKIVVIDAGHGGKDPGTVVGIAKEKNIVLDIALKLGKLVKQNQKNIKVVFTRDGDYYIPLMDRAQIANKINADLFISIHANYCDSPSIIGTETYVLGLHRTVDNLNVAKKENSVILLEDDYTTRYEGFNPNLSESYIMFELIQDTYLEQSLKFASILQSNFKNQAQRHDREVRQAGFLVLRETAMPSVLIETGYLSNKKENSYLLSDNGRSEIAQSIYGSLINYLGKVNAKDNTAFQSVVKTERDTQNTHTSTVTSKPKAIEAETKTYSNKAQIYNNIQTDTNAIPDSKTTYAIQIGVFSKRIGTASKIFKGMSPIREIIKEGMYKYLCYESDTLEKTLSKLSTVKRYFPEAFVVSVKNNKTKMIEINKSKK